jgi:pimeloyl-ACP methyl ester carboxylesterase
VAIESCDLLPEQSETADRLLPDAVGHVETWNDVLRLQREGIEPQAFSAITARVLMLHGDTDPHPGAATRDLLRQYIPHLEYQELERCGHEPWRERHAASRFIELLRDWVGRS